MHPTDIFSLPEIVFAHSHSCNDYINYFMPQKNRIEVCYVSAGRLHMETDDELITAETGDVICLLHDRKMRIYSEGFSAHHTVCAELQWQCPGPSGSGFYLPLRIPQDSDVSRICQLIDSFVYGQNSYEESHIKNSYDFLQILSEIDRCSRFNMKDTLPKSYLYIERAKNYIHLHIHDQISQAEVAEHLGISPGYLCSLFKKTPEKSLIRYVNKTKLKAISQIIESRSLKLYEAAAMFGYDDPNYVSRLYKKLFGHNITDKPNPSNPDLVSGSFDS